MMFFIQFGDWIDGTGTGLTATTGVIYSASLMNLFRSMTADDVSKVIKSIYSM